MLCTIWRARRGACIVSILSPFTLELVEEVHCEDLFAIRKNHMLDVFPHNFPEVPQPQNHRLPLSLYNCHSVRLMLGNGDPKELCLFPLLLVPPFLGNRIGALDALCPSVQISRVASNNFFAFELVLYSKELLPRAPTRVKKATDLLQTRA